MTHSGSDDRARPFLSRTRLTRRQALRGAAGLGLALPAFATLGDFAGAQGTPKAGGTLKMGMQADPAQLDPPHHPAHRRLARHRARLQRAYPAE